MSDTWSTVGDLAKATGRTTRTIERWWRAGVIPPCDLRNEEGWKLWGTAKTRQIIDIAAKRKKQPPKEED